MNETSVYGIHSIDHLAFNVPSITDASRFANAFGFDVRPVNDGKELELRTQDGHRWARMLSSDNTSLAYLSFNCFAEDIDRIRKQVQAAGVPMISPPAGQDQSGFWCHDPDGNTLQVKVGPKTSPYFKIPGMPMSAVANVRGAECHADLKQVRPRRMSHVLLFTLDVPRTLSFYEGGLGLKVSDRTPNAVFTHAQHGCDHHLVAFGQSSKRGWHHCSWDVADINEVGKGGAQMAAAGYTRNWGTGRHVLGSNYFHYVGDPWGHFWEYCADIDFIAAGSQWSAGNFPPEDTAYLWGPDIPDYFLKNPEAI